VEQAFRLAKRLQQKIRRRGGSAADIFLKVCDQLAESVGAGG
jgi:hypothetical protein